MVTFMHIAERPDTDQLARGGAHFLSHSIPQCRKFTQHANKNIDIKGILDESEIVLLK